MIDRMLKISKSGSFFLFGARGTGKSTMVEALFKEEGAIFIDLLQPQLFSRLLAYPEELSKLVGPAVEKKGWIVIDEVQKVPALLDLIHWHIEKTGLLFALTGSSARKLRRGAANLLAGRAFTYRLFPLLAVELGLAFDLEHALRWGTLPKLLSLNDDNDKSRFLQSYTETYLQEEILVEQVIRNLPPFRRFLQVAAQTNGQIVNFSKIAVDVATDPSNVRNYFQILEDTLLGFFLEPFHSSIRKRQRQAPKFYFVDCGIVRALAQLLDVPLRASTYEYGRLFETLVINEIRALLSYSGRQFQLSYLHTREQAEVDLIVERGGEKTLLIEIKSATNVQSSELNNLSRFRADIPGSRAVCLYRGEMKQCYNNVEILPWREGLVELGIA